MSPYNTTILTHDIVRELLDYDPETGKLIWRYRARNWFSRDADCYTWNKRFAGKPAFTAVRKAGYHVGAIFGKMYQAHRVIWLWMAGGWPDEIDHINHVKTDNRWANLRNVSDQENKKNRPIQCNNQSGVVGVSYHLKAQKYHARLKVGRRCIYLGLHETIEVAQRAVENARVTHGFHPNHGRIAA